MDVPIYVTASVLAVAAFGVLAVPSVLAPAGRNLGHGGRSTGTVGIALAAWFVGTLILASFGAYRPAVGELVPAVSIALVVTLTGLGLAVAALPWLRAALTDPARQPRLLALHIWRIEGLAFLVLLAQGQLPALFAVPAGLGDLAIGLTAPMMARNLHRRGLAIAWNVFGLADLAVAVSLGAMTTPGAAQLFITTPTSEALTAFPMAIIPTFLVPLSIGLHVVSLRYLLFARGRTAGSAHLTSA
jgi:hypothetical protein